MCLSQIVVMHTKEGGMANERNTSNIIIVEPYAVREN